MNDFDSGEGRVRVASKLRTAAAGDALESRRAWRTLVVVGSGEADRGGFSCWFETECFSANLHRRASMLSVIATGPLLLRGSLRENGSGNTIFCFML